MPNLAICDVLIHDADGALAATATGIVPLVDASRRQRRKAADQALKGLPGEWQLFAVGP